MVNKMIREDFHRVVHENIPLEQAKTMGAMALFGEKYGDIVRVIRTGWPEEELVSQELCGGTHVEMTAEIGPFVAVSEGSVGAGIRRIEAVTGRGAQALIQGRLDKMNNASAYLLCSPDELDRKVQDLIEQAQTAQKELGRLQREMAQHELEALMDSVTTIAGVPVLVAQVKAPSVDAMRDMTDWFRTRVGSGVAVLGATIEGRPQIVAAVTSDLTGRGLHAGKLAGAVAKLVGGGGGGKPTLASAGGRDAKRLPEALSLVPKLVSEALGA